MGPEKQARRGIQYTSTAITSPAISAQTTRKARRQSHKAQQVHACRSTRASQHRQKLSGRRGAHNQETQNGDCIHKAQRGGNTAYREKVDIPHRMAHKRSTPSTSTGKGHPLELRRRIGAPELVRECCGTAQPEQQSASRRQACTQRSWQLSVGVEQIWPERLCRGRSGCLILPTVILRVHIMLRTLLTPCSGLAPSHSHLTEGMDQFEKQALSERPLRAVPTTVFRR